MKKKYQQTNKERNEKIVKQINKGMSYRDVAVLHELSDTRVRQIYLKMKEDEK